MGGDNVNYLWFIKAVDSADNVLGNLGQISRGAAMPKSTGKGQVQEAPAARIRNLVKLDIKSLLLKLRAQSQALSIDKPETFFQGIRSTEFRVNPSGQAAQCS